MLSLLEQFTQQYRDSAEMPTALYQIAWLSADQQRAADAEAAFRRIAEDYAATRYWGDAVYRLAERAVQVSDTTAAKQWLDRLSAADDIDPDVRVHGLNLQGKLAIDGHQWEEALPPLQRLASEFSSHKLKTPAEYWLAEALFRLGEWYEDAANKAGCSAADRTGSG